MTFLIPYFYFNSIIWIILLVIALELDFPGGSDSEESTCNVGDSGLIPCWEDPLEKGMATHSSVLAWRIP